VNDILQRKLEPTMSTHISRQAVVIGAGMAGLTAARALADYFDHVTILENDTLPAGAATRAGTPQSKHAHTLLGGGQLALATLFPGFEQSLQEAGAIPTGVASDYWLERPGYDPFPQRDLGMVQYSMTRPLIESVVRRKVADTGNVELREGCRAQRLVTTADRTAVTGVNYTHRSGEVEDVVAADFVIDASSHGLLTLNLLAAIGQPPEETTVGVDIGYASALFEIPPEAPSNWKIAITLPDPPANRRGVFVFPVEGNRWIVSLGGRYHEKPPDDEAGFFAHLQQQRTHTVYNAVKGAKRLTDITRYGFKANRWRHFEKLAAFPGGLLPFGDTICRFNPVYGQGMTVASQEACLLQRVLADAAAAGKGLELVAPEFLAQAQTIIDAAWRSAVIPDFLDPLTEGERPAEIEKALKFTAALLKASSEDEEIHKLMIEVSQLMKPRSALRDPAISGRIRAAAARAE
jgi:2-polyprenyl-6-methoxyphenol hydroxylase-like FAD-dependent oxidoreductase